ncbi:hypothetical protein B0H14DRAFT_2619013 [Mycena olivaceomarginata]|nr:hypothetical protein B0H14DRAFT_2619013 [Mycena olivaceomarginata]
MGSRMVSQILLPMAVYVDPQLTNKWREEFDPTFKFKRLFNMSELDTSDIKATNSYRHQRYHLSESAVLPSTRSNAVMLLGKGISVCNGPTPSTDGWRIMTPAFGVAQIRLITEIFFEIAGQDIWSQQIALGQKDSAQVDVLSGLRRMTLDVIGKSRAHRNARAKMDSIANRIVMESKANAKLEGLDAKRALVSVLVKARMPSSLPESQRLTQAEVIAHNPSMEELNSLPYIETVDPQGPNDPHIPVLAGNTDTEIWGEDAREFIPERWENLPDAVSLVPGVWANLLTFFAGTTNCIGFWFSLVEHVSLYSLPCSSRPPVHSSSKRRFRRAVFGTLQPDSLRLAHPPFMVHIVSLFAEFPFDSGSGSDFLWSNREYMKFPIGSTPPASVDQLWTGGPGEDGAESKKPQPRKRNVFDSDNYIEDDEHDTAEGSYREIWRAEFVRLGELPCVDGVRLESAREVREISVATVESRGDIHAMHEVHGSTFWVKFNHIMGMGSGDGKPVFCSSTSLVDMVTY